MHFEACAGRCLSEWNAHLEVTVGNRGGNILGILDLSEFNETRVVLDCTGDQLRCLCLTLHTHIRESDQMQDKATEAKQTGCKSREGEGIGEGRDLRGDDDTLLLLERLVDNPLSHFSLLLCHLFRFHCACKLRAEGKVCLPGEKNRQR